MSRYAAVAGVQAKAPTSWPTGSQVARDTALPTLVMFLHPRCPCSRASVQELDRLIAKCQGRLKAHVLFLCPDGMGEDFVRTGLWQQAEAIPGVTVKSDDGGREASLFGAGTSGQTMLYDRDGTLMFAGGITISRGHEGDNPGSDAVMACLEHKLPVTAVTPTFGCSLSGIPRSQANVP